MKTRNRFIGLRAAIAIALAGSFWAFGSPAVAQDDGARAYWKLRDGSHVVSAQYLFMDINSSDTSMFDPSHFIYPNSDAEADIFMASYAHHFTLFDRPSSVSLNLVGGSVDVDANTNLIPAQFLPTGVLPGVLPGASFSQSASGFADPTLQLDVNLFGTPPLKSTVDLLNYEPTFTIDAAIMVAAPLGQYDDDKLVNMGQNRFFGRIALPMKYHFGAFAPGYMTSVEVIPSVWLFGPNDDFLGGEMENDPLWQVEAHVTHDFTRTFSASLDFLYRNGFESEINGVTVGDELNVGDLGMSLDFRVTEDLSLRTGYSTNVFGDSDLENGVARLQLIYSWHRLTENARKLSGGD